MTAERAYIDPEMMTSGDSSTLQLPVPNRHERYLKVTDGNGNIHLFPVSHLPEADRSVFENEAFLASVKRGVTDLKEGRYSAADWVLDDE